MKTNILTLISRYYDNQLTNTEKHEIAEFICIYKRNDYEALWMVNDFLTNSDSWDNFPTIRSMNTYNGFDMSIPGIQPRYFAIVSNLLHHAHSPKTYIEKITYY